jgi:flagellin
MRINLGIISALSKIGAPSITTRHAKQETGQSPANRCDRAEDVLDIASANLSASDSRITDFAMAMRMIASTKGKIIGSADVSVLGQANQTQREILDLIQ